MLPSLRNQPIAERLETGLRLHAAGNLPDAAAIYTSVLEKDHDNADSLHRLGMIFHQVGHVQIAVACFERSLDLAPSVANCHGNFAYALRDLGRLDEAIAHFALAARLRWDSPQILCNLATTLCEAGKAEQAMAAYRRALALDPALTEAWFNLAAPLAAAGDPDRAERFYRRALRLDPGFADAAFQLGNLLFQSRRLDAAEAAFRAAIGARPGIADHHNNLGVALQEQSRLEEAAARYAEALALDPDHADAAFNRGSVFLAQNRLAEATASFERLLERHPGHAAAKLALCMGQLPVLYATAEEIPERRRAYAERLNRLADNAGPGAGPDAQALADAIGSSQPFFLPYQGENDRDLQSRYGAMACRLLADPRPLAARRRRRRSGERIRVGVVSGYFHEHTVWRLFIDRWLTQMDRTRFALFGYHTGLTRDARTDESARLCDRFVERRQSGAQWRQTILADSPDVLLYPEVGMDPMAGHLAAQRLAPLQCVTWGHPNTTGMPTMDCFLTSALMEPPDADALYTEKLIRLPNLGVCYGARDWPPSPPSTPPQRAALGLRPSAMVYWSGQALYKYLPQHDAVFPRIARAVGDCQFVFIAFAKSQAVTDLFRARLERAFAAYGLRAADHCVILPSMPEERFIDAVRQSDALLDTIGWSGGKSTLDCLSAHDAPIVTLPGAFLRGRHSAAILTRLGVTDTIAESLDAYVAIAARLGVEAEWRNDLRRRMAAARHRAFDDRACVEALESFLVNAVERAGESVPVRADPRFS